MSRTADTIQKNIRELVCRLMQLPSRRSSEPLPAHWTPDALAQGSDKQDIPFDERCRFLIRRNREISNAGALPARSADEAGINDSASQNPASKPRTSSGESKADSEGAATTDSGNREPAQLNRDDELQAMAQESAQLARELAPSLSSESPEDNFSGISKAACWVHLTRNLTREIALLRDRDNIQRSGRATAELENQAPTGDSHRIAPDTLESSLDLLKKMVDWHGGSLEEGDGRICPRQLHQRAFLMTERMLNSVWADPHSKNSAEKIRLGFDSISQIRLLTGSALAAYCNLWDLNAASHSSAEAAGFGPQELELITGQKPLELADMKALLAEIGESLDWCERQLGAAREEWEKAKTILDQAQAELKAGKLGKAEALQAQIAQRDWLDLDVEAVCRALDAILNKHLAEINAAALRDNRKAIALASRYADQYAHSPRIKKGFLKRKYGIESEMLIASSSRKSMAGGASTIILYGVIAAIAFSAVVFWFDYSQKQKAIHQESVEREWIEKIDRELSAARAKAAEETNAAQQEGAQTPATDKN